jgi:hypothetical protein
MLPKKLEFNKLKKLGLSQIWTFKNWFYLILRFWKHFVTKQISIFEISAKILDFLCPI